MKRFFSILLIVVILCSVSIIPTAAAKNSAVVKDGGYPNEDKWLTLSKNTTGPRYFVDMKGNPVQLFGMARCQSHAHEENVLFSSTDGVDAVIDHYTKEGCNFIRLAINVEEIAGGMVRTPEQLQDFITRRVDPDVQAIIRSGAYVMLDMHEIAAPGAGNTIEAYNTWARDYYMPFTIALAKFYKDEPMVAAYELWNEPFSAPYSDIYPDAREGWSVLLREYFIENVNKIREIDTRHVILVSDANAGWGTTMATTWDGYYDAVDPVYRNTCFSVHAQHDQLDYNYGFYSDWWKQQASKNNICILFGELETEPNIVTEQGLKNLYNFLEETKDEYHFSGVMWRPYADHVVYAHLWLTNGWSRKYCNPAPAPSARYVSEAEDSFGGKNNNIELLKEADLFGYETGSGISLKPNLNTTQFYESSAEISSNVIYKEGKYKLLVRACGRNGYDGDFIVGYRDIDGAVHQIARFDGKNTNGEHYYQSVEFTAEKKIVSFVYFGCEASKNSAVIDRVYIVGKESDNETVSRSRTSFADINKIIDLNGKIHYVNGTSGNEVVTDLTVDKTEDTVSQEDEEPQEDADSKKESGKVIHKTNTTVTDKAVNPYIYVGIGGGVLAVTGLFVVIYIFVVKRRIKKND